MAWNSAHTEQEKEWFEQVAKGDEMAFAQLFHYYNARLFPFVRKITRSETIAEEIVQECFLRLWLHREKLAGMEQPGAWLFLVASNLSMTHLRNSVNRSIKHRAASVSPEREPAHDPFGRLEGKELAILLEAAIRQLPPRRQEVFRLSRQEGLGHKEIAARLGLSPNTVKDHLVIALKTIKAQIEQQSDTIVGVLVLMGLLKK